MKRHYLNGPLAAIVALCIVGCGRSETYNEIDNSIRMRPAVAMGSNISNIIESGTLISETIKPDRNGFSDADGTVKLEPCPTGTIVVKGNDMDGSDRVMLQEDKNGICSRSLPTDPNKLCTYGDERVDLNRYHLIDENGYGLTEMRGNYSHSGDEILAFEGHPYAIECIGEDTKWTVNFPNY